MVSVLLLGRARICLLLVCSLWPIGGHVTLAFLKISEFPGSLLCCGVLMGHSLASQQTLPAVAVSAAWEEG